jgi:hypothetical protein
MAYADNEGFDEHVEIWGLGDIDCTLFKNEDLWKGWKIKENDDKIAENQKIIRQNNRKLWSLGNIEFWSTDDDDDDEKKAYENEWDKKIAEIVDQNSDASTQCGYNNVGTLDELWEDDETDDTFDEGKNTIEKKYNKIISDYLEGVEIVFTK